MVYTTTAFITAPTSEVKEGVVGYTRVHGWYKEGVGRYMGGIKRVWEGHG
jgi:hypothetical protein